MTFALLGMTAAVFFKWAGYIIVALLCLMVMIVIHELGHYIAGKLFKFKINEFAIGFGPAIFKYTNKKNGEVFSIRCIPLGGFCAFAGEDEQQTNPDDFNAKPVWQRIIVLFAGAFFNFFSAILIISIFFMSYGEYYPKVAQSFGIVSENGIVIEQVLKDDDVILKVDGKPTYALLEQFSKLSRGLKDKDSAVLTISRDGQIIEVVATKGMYSYDKTNDDGSVEHIEQIGIGVTLNLQRVKLGFFHSLGHAFGFAFDVIGLIFRSFGGLFTGALKVNETLGGTVTAISSLAEMTSMGFPAVMYGLCVLSASLAIMNILPLPALDGGRIVFCIIEAIRRKPINKKTEGIIHTVGLFVLLALAIILDLVHFLA